MADKIGNYKIIMIVALIMGIGAQNFVLWLMNCSNNTIEMLDVESSNITSSSLSWDGSSLELVGSQFFSDESPESEENMKVWLQVQSCHFDESIASNSCARLTQLLNKVHISKEYSRQTGWNVSYGLSSELLNSCSQFYCSVSIENAT